MCSLPGFPKLEEACGNAFLPGYMAVPAMMKDQVLAQFKGARFYDHTGGLVKTAVSQDRS